MSNILYIKCSKLLFASFIPVLSVLNVVWIDGTPLKDFLGTEDQEGFSLRKTSDGKLLIGWFHNDELRTAFDGTFDEKIEVIREYFFRGTLPPTCEPEPIIKLSSCKAQFPKVHPDHILFNGNTLCISKVFLKGIYELGPLVSNTTLCNTITLTAKDVETIVTHPKF